MSAIDYCEQHGVKASWCIAEPHESRNNKTTAVAPAPALEHDPVDHPSHYTAHPSGVECIDITRHMIFNRGNAVKYIWRAGEKGDVVEDLRKARWYLADEIKRLGGEL